MTRLESHKMTFFGSKGVGNRLRFEELDNEEVQLVYRSFVERIGGRESEMTNEQYCREYCQTLCSWGIMCPHPQAFRLYGGRRFAVHFGPNDYRWYVCEMCDASVINR